MRKLPKDVLKMASGLISPSGLAGHCGQLCSALSDSYAGALLRVTEWGREARHVTTEVRIK